MSNEIEIDTTVSGSDAPIVMGVSPWARPGDLYARKRGLVEDQDEPSPAMQRGTALEPLVADYYAEATQRVLEQPPGEGKVVSQTIPWLTGHVDRLIPDERGPGVLEIKCPGLSVFGKIMRQGVPDYYQVQLQHYLLATGLNWGALAVFNAERWSLLHFDVPRDDRLIAVILTREAAFRDAVIEGVPPTDVAMPALDLPSGGGTVVQVDSPVWASAARDWRLARELRAEAEDLEAHAKDRLTKVLDESKAEAGEGAGLRVYYRMQAGRTTLDKAAMKRDGIDVAKYERQGKPFRSFKGYVLKGEQNG